MVRAFIFCLCVRCFIACVLKYAACFTPTQIQNLFALMLYARRLICLAGQKCCLLSSFCAKNLFALMSYSGSLR